MRTLVASPEEPPRRPLVTGAGWTHAGPGFTVAWPATYGTTAATLLRLDVKTSTG